MNEIVLLTFEIIYKINYLFVMLLQYRNDLLNFKSIVTSFVKNIFLFRKNTFLISLQKEVIFSYFSVVCQNGILYKSMNSGQNKFLQ